MSDYLSLVISILALCVSVVTFWLAHLRRGSIEMTKPTVIYFGPDRSVESKVFIRTLLYSTSDKGQYVENMYLRLSHQDWSQVFNIWVYGEPTNLSRGSGLFVSRHGLAANHHFLLPKDGSKFKVLAGDYRVEIYVEVVGRKPRKIYTETLTVGKDEAKALLKKDAGLYFDWAPNLQKWQSFIDRK